jgi:hypothetical protein
VLSAPEEPPKGGLSCGGSFVKIQVGSRLRAVWSLGMSDPTEVDNDLERLQMALEALSADLDAIMRRPHFSLRFAAENLVNDGSQRIERVVDHFAFAVKRGALP